MKIIVDKLPECPRDCLFSRKVYKQNNLYACILHEYIKELDIGNIGCKPPRICSSVKDCKHLITESKYD